MRIEQQETLGIEQLYVSLLHDYCKYISSEWDGQSFIRVKLEDLYCEQEVLAKPADGYDEDFQLPSGAEILKEMAISGRSIEEVLDALKKRSIDDTVAVPQQRQPRFFLSAQPGAGKTTWCKKTCLACLETPTQITHSLHFLNHIDKKNDKWFPILLPCRNYSANSIDPERFEQIAYSITNVLFQSQFQSSVSIQGFSALIDEKAEAGSLLVVVDGLDEILDNQDRITFINSLVSFSNRFPNIPIILTSRPFDEITVELKSGQFNYVQLVFIPFSKKNIRDYCKKWHEAVFEGDAQLVQNYQRVITQLESRQYSSMEYMTRSPYLLSNLLRLSVYSGRLPTSTLELYSKTFEMMVEWTTKLDSGIDKTDVIIQLAYIANAMTKQHRLSINREELIKIITQCFIDLDGFFRQPIRQDNIPQYVEIFTIRNCVLKPREGTMYSFPHKQMQEYLTAYAIMNGFSDEEDRERNQLDILRNRYDCNSLSQIDAWEEIVVFCALIGDARFSHELVKELLKLARDSNEQKSALYNDFLFSFCISGVFLSKKDKHAIFDSCFRDHISAKHIEDVCDIVSDYSSLSSELKQYIDSRFVDGINTEEVNYFSIQAVLKATEYELDGINPLDRALDLSISQSKADVITGFAIIDLLAWCKVNNVGRRNLGKYFDDNSITLINHRITQVFFESFNRWIDVPFILSRITAVFRECILADFVDYRYVNNIVSTKLMNSLLQQATEDSSFNSACNNILDIWPLPHHSELFNNKLIVSETQRNQTLSEFEKVIIEEADSNQEPIFVFNRCIALNVWNSLDNVIDAFDAVSKQRISHFSDAGARLSQVQKSLQYTSFKIKMDNGIYDIRVFVNSNITRLSNENVNYLFDDNGRNLSILENTPFPLSSFSNDFLNNCGYLLRRNEINCTLKKQDPSFSLDASFFLEPLLSRGDPFVLINYALFKSGFYINHIGDYSLGLSFLADKDLHNNNRILSAASWWFDVACDDEIEGLVVILWLYRLGCLPIGGSTKENSTNSSVDPNYCISDEDMRLTLECFQNEATLLGEIGYNTFVSLCKKYGVL